MVDPSAAPERFLLRGELGRGAMGVVYRAFDRQAGREVALKTLLRSRSGTALERVWREARAAGALQHPGVVRVHECLELPDGPTIVYELVEGARPLREHLRSERPQAERVDLVLQVARAMAHAHAQGVVHRDLKPDNVLVDAAGQARVTDFGLAWQVGAESLTRTGAALGTPHYMAPELLGLRPGDARDPRVDVWALGVILYQALCLRLPFDAGSLVEFMSQVARASPSPPRQVETATPAALEAVCLTALRADPAARYADAGELSRALEAALAAPPGRPRLRWGPLAALVLLSGLAALLLARARGPEPSPPPPPAPDEAPPAPSPAAPSPPALPAGWSLRAGQTWSTGCGYHVVERRDDGGRCDYDMQYDVTLSVERVADASATLRLQVDQIGFAMRERGTPPLVVDTRELPDPHVRLVLPAERSFLVELALPSGQVQRVRGAGRLKREILRSSAKNDELVLDQVLLDLDDTFMEMNLGLLLGLFPAGPPAPRWSAVARLRPSGSYPLRLRFQVQPQGQDGLRLGNPEVLEADPRLARVDLRGEGTWAEGRLTAARVRLQLRIQDPDMGRDVELLFLLGGERPRPLASLAHPP